MNSRVRFSLFKCFVVSYAGALVGRVLLLSCFSSHSSTVKYDLFVCLFESERHIAQVGLELELMSLLSPPLKCWGSRCAPPSQAYVLLGIEPRTLRVLDKCSAH